MIAHIDFLRLIGQQRFTDAEANAANAAIRRRITPPDQDPRFIDAPEREHWGIRLAYPDGDRVVFDFDSEEAAAKHIFGVKQTMNPRAMDPRWIDAVPERLPDADDSGDLQPGLENGRWDGTSVVYGGTE